MRVLLLTNMWPSSKRPYLGAFLVDHAKELERYGLVETVYVPTTESRWNYLKFWWRIENRPDFVVVHHSLLVPLAFVLSFRFFFRPKVVAYIHEGELAFKKGAKVWLQRSLANLAHARVSVSPSIVNKLSKPLVVIPIGVNGARFGKSSKDEARAILKLMPKPVVFFPGDPRRKEKRFDLCSEAIARLSLNGIDFTILTGGAIPFEEMPLYYAAADVVVVCSDYEASSTAIKEGLASGKPVVTTRTGDYQAYEGTPLVIACDSTVEGVAAAVAKAVKVGMPQDDTTLSLVDNKKLVSKFVSFLESL